MAEVLSVSLSASVLSLEGKIGEINSASGGKRRTNGGPWDTTA
jgi:hypothetical protein